VENREGQHEIASFSVRDETLTRIKEFNPILKWQETCPKINKASRSLKIPEGFVCY
jgi:hypothetical protein